jgi:hypothetical protein
MNTRITRTLASAAAAVLVGAVLVASHAGAHVAPRTGTDSDQPDGSGWTPYQQPDIHYSAGQRCEFPVEGKVVLDQEEYRDVSHWPGGQVRTQLWRGALVIRWTNLESGESVRRDQSADAIAEYASDGSLESLTSLRGSFGAGIPEGGHPGKGAYVVGGRWSSVVFEDDGTRTIVLGPRGTLENLCETLG